MLDITEAKYLGNCKFDLIFENGEKGVVDLSCYAKRGGVFAEFENAAFIRQGYANKELGPLCWPGGADIAPETLYDLSKSSRQTC